MRRVRFICLFLPLLMFISCSKTDCGELPSSFSSYDEAKSRVLSVDFVFEDKMVNCNSSWIEDVYFYSCDGKVGYMYMITKQGKDYIHQGMPVEVWQAFKKAESLGRFYNLRVKGKYRVRLHR